MHDGMQMRAPDARALLWLHCVNGSVAASMVVHPQRAKKEARQPSGAANTEKRQLPAPDAQAHNAPSPDEMAVDANPIHAPIMAVAMETPPCVVFRCSISVSSLALSINGYSATQ